MRNYQLPFVFLLAMSVFAITEVSAQKLVVSSSEGNEMVELSKISEITFENNKMMLTTTDEVLQEYDIANIENLTFDFSSNVKECITQTLGDITFKNNHGIITLSGTGELNAQVYDMKGCVVTGATGKNSVMLDLTALSNGVYIIKTNNKTIKFTR